MRGFVAALVVLAATSVSAQPAEPAPPCREGVTAVVKGGVSVDETNAAATIATLRGVTRIEGGLWIHNTTVQDLTGLECLTALAGGLIVESNPDLTTLEGLHHLTSVAARVFISQNQALRDLDGLRALHDKVGQIQVWDNASLTNIKGLRGIDGLTGFTGQQVGAFDQAAVDIHGNPHLTDLDGLQGITQSDLVFILRNAGLQSLAGLDGLTKVDMLNVTSNAQSSRSLGCPARVDGPPPRVHGNPRLDASHIAELSKRVGVAVDQRSPEELRKAFQKEREERDAERSKLARKQRRAALPWHQVLLEDIYRSVGAAFERVVTIFPPLGLYVFLTGASIMFWPLWVLACVAVAWVAATRWRGLWRIAGLPPLLTLPIPLLIVWRLPMTNLEPPIVFGVWAAIVGTYALVVLAARTLHARWSASHEPPGT